MEDKSHLQKRVVAVQPSTHRILQAIVSEMLPSLRILLQLLQSLSAYDAVCRANIQPAHIKPLVKQLTDLRKTSLAMLFAILGLYVQANRVAGASWVIALIVLTSNICSMYDYVDDEKFKTRVDAVGPIIFTLINTIPGFAVTTLLCREMIRNSESPAAGVLQVLLALLPGLWQVFGEALLLYRKSLTVAPNSADEAPSLA